MYIPDRNKVMAQQFIFIRRFSAHLWIVSATYRSRSTMREKNFLEKKILFNRSVTLLERARVIA